MPEITRCKYCGSTCMILDVTSGCRLGCTRCRRSVSSPTLRKTIKKWADDPVTIAGLPWPDLMCGKCKVAPVLESEDAGGYCFICPSCKASSEVRPTPYDAMLAWMDGMSNGGGYRCRSS